MPTLGLPTPMFVIFVVTVLAGSLGAVHYLVAHVIMGRPFAETPPPVLQAGDGDARPGEAPAPEGPPADPSEGAGAARGGEERGGEEAGGEDPAPGSPRG